MNIKKIIASRKKLILVSLLFILITITIAFLLTYNKNIETKKSLSDCPTLDDWYNNLNRQIESDPRMEIISRIPEFNSEPIVIGKHNFQSSAKNQTLVYIKIRNNLNQRNSFIIVLENITKDKRCYLETKPEKITLESGEEKILCAVCSLEKPIKTNHIIKIKDFHSNEVYAQRVIHIG